MKKEIFLKADFLDQRIEGIESAINFMDKSSVSIHERIKSVLLAVMPDDIEDIEKVILNKLKEKQRKLKKEFENLK